MNRLSTLFLSLSIVACITAGYLFIRNLQLNRSVTGLENDNNELTEKMEKAKSDLEALEQKNEELKTALMGFYSRTLTGSLGNADRDVEPAGFVAGSGNVIETSIDGEFDGWDGDTIFKLMNGQIWQQESFAYTYHYAYMPGVIIYKKNGGYYMRVDNVDGEIRVKRIK
jgi:FtsZ-binding cell division protein ZapB